MKATSLKGILCPVVDAFKVRLAMEELIIVADVGLLSKENLNRLEKGNCQYILGARIKNETLRMQEQILVNKPENEKSICLQKEDGTKLIVSYSSSRAEKDASNRKRRLEKLQKRKLTKVNINNRGYNKYLKMEGSIHICIDREKYDADARWDGLKDYLTSTNLSKEEVIENYKQLWMIEKTFRISKTDLQMKPIYHRIPQRIEAHICIVFCAYKIYKKMETAQGNRIDMERRKCIRHYQDYISSFHQNTLI